MAYKKELFGKMPDGREAERYTLTNRNGLSASFLTLGGIWETMLAPDRDGRFDDVVLGYANVENYIENPPHFGAPVGRNANRIAGGRFVLGGREYKLALNDGPNNLHSGPDYYRKRLWAAEAAEDSASTTVTFYLESPDGDQGYPGDARISLSYTLTDEDSLKIAYRMVCDADTVANFTNHSYFNLAGHKAGDILSQRVWIDGDGFTDIDENLIPTGEIVPVAGTPMDFTSPKEIGKDLEADYRPLRLAGGYDHNWVLNHKPGELSLCARALDPGSGRQMEVYTDLPGLQFYIANFLEPELPGKENAYYGKRAAYCFETQYYPNAVNTPSFPSAFLKAGEEYRTTTVYHFKKM